MTAHAQILATGDPAVWDTATDEVNAWRGAAIQLFAKAELAVSETLILLTERPGHQSKFRLRRLVGQRFGDLAVALEELDGKNGAKAAAALAGFRELEDLRPFLCHGVAKIAIDRRGNWIAAFRLKDVRAGNAVAMSKFFEEAEARMLIDELSRRTRDLSAKLQSVRSKLSPGTPSS